MLVKSIIKTNPSSNKIPINFVAQFVLVKQKQKEEDQNPNENQGNNNLAKQVTIKIIMSP